MSSSAPQALPDAPDITKVFENLRRRASRLRTKAARILAVIVGVLLSGITVFVTAGALANRETATVVDETRLATRTSLLRERESLQAEQKQATELLAETRMTLEKEGSTGQGPVARALQEQIANLLERTATLQRQLAELDTRANQLLIPASVSIPKEAQLASLISAISTRIGAILLLIFLVQILVPLYRYTLKLSAHYDACADTLELAFIHGEAIEHAGFVALFTALSPQSADFGAPPSLPAAELLRVANEIASRR